MTHEQRSQRTDRARDRHLQLIRALLPSNVWKPHTMFGPGVPPEMMMAARAAGVWLWLGDEISCRFVMESGRMVSGKTGDKIDLHLRIPERGRLTLRTFPLVAIRLRKDDEGTWSPIAVAYTKMAYLPGIVGEDATQEVLRSADEVIAEHFDPARLEEAFADLRHVARVLEA